MPAAIVQEANGRPISVFVSLKEGKLYVRQGWKPLFEAPVSFEHPDQPIGTHVYTAMGVKADGGGPALDRGVDPERHRRVAEAKARTTAARSARAAVTKKPVEIATPMPSPSAGARPHRHAAGTGRAHFRADHARLVADRVRKILTKTPATPDSRPPRDPRRLLMRRGNVTEQ